jgi:hypothetical protein
MYRNAFFTLRFIAIHLICIGIYITRHPGRDCRDPEVMDGNAKSGYVGLCIYVGRISSAHRMHGAVYPHIKSHILVFWIPAIPAGMTAIRFV